MPSKFFDRRIEVSVAGLTIRDLRINFEIDRQMDETQDRGHIDIYNLNEQNEERVTAERGIPITLSAGYPDTIAVIFSGQLQRVVSARENLARITRIEIGDAVRNVEKLGSVFNKTYDHMSGPYDVAGIVPDIAAAMGLPLGPLDAIPEGAQLPGFYWSGVAERALSSLLRRFGCYWFEQDGLLRINRQNVTQSDAPDVRISPATGLVGSPVATDEGVEARCFLRPDIFLGCRIELESDTRSGTFKCVGLRHKGDNWSGSFVTLIDLRSLEAEAEAESEAEAEAEAEVESGDS